MTAPGRDVLAGHGLPGSRPNDPGASEASEASEGASLADGSHPEGRRRPAHRISSRRAAAHPGPGHRAGALSGLPARIPGSVLVAAAIVVVGLARVATASGDHLWLGGDQAVLALQVHEAMHFHALLGPYSRFGWSHPGPALFYAAAPFYALGAGSSWSLALASVVLNGLAVVLTVIVVRHFAGAASSWWSLGTTATVLIGTGAGAWFTFWNPDLEAAVLLLYLVLAAAACTGSLHALVGAALAATYLVQTDVGVVPVVGVMAIVAASACGIQLLRGRRPDRAWPLPVSAALMGAGLTAIVLAWVPPIVQQLTTHRGNITRLVHFFTSPVAPTPATTPPSHSLGQAWDTVATVVGGSVLHHVPTATVVSASAADQVVVIVDLLVAGAAVLWGLRRRSALAVGLGSASFAGIVIAVASATRVVGPIYTYLMQWAILVPVPGWIAVGVLARDEVVASVSARTNEHRVPVRFRRAATAAVALLALVPTVWFASQVNAAAPEVANQTDAVTIAALVVRQQDGAARDLQVVMANADRWPVASGVVLRLVEEGFHPTVPPSWAFMFTDRFVGSGVSRWHLVLSNPAESPVAPIAGVPSTIVPGPEGPTRVQLVPPGTR